jgi:3'(2'), 5'-bisphosphate nucleotidase
MEDGERRHEIRTRARSEPATAVASKSHLNQATIDYLEAAVGACGYVAVGSSLKFCIVAEGEADIYPRASPTSEWDTAAGHAVLLAAGGLVDGPDGTPLSYGKPAFLNRAFVATAGWKPPRLEPYLKSFSGGGDLPAGT